MAINYCLPVSRNFTVKDDVDPYNIGVSGADHGSPNWWWGIPLFSDYGWSPTGSPTNLPEADQEVVTSQFACNNQTCNPGYDDGISNIRYYTTIDTSNQYNPLINNTTWWKNQRCAGNSGGKCYRETDTMCTDSGFMCMNYDNSEECNADDENFCSSTIGRR